MQISLAIKTGHLFICGLIAVMAFALPVRAADTQKIEAFLEVTGFDVALESIRLSADTAPQILGLEADDFGSEWKRLVAEVFETKIMHDMAIDILSKTLDEDILDHGAAFYASELGRRLVRAENASHMVEDDTDKSQTGEEIVAALIRIGSPRTEILKRMNRAIDVSGTTIASIHEVQIRFLMAAAAAGVIELQMDEPDLREVMRRQESELRLSIQKSALSGAAYTYQAFTDDEVTAYADALEHPKMQELYTLMNAVQFEITANRYEAVAARLAGMQPSQDL
jgi:hypothetical protein